MQKVKIKDSSKLLKNLHSAITESKKIIDPDEHHKIFSAFGDKDLYALRTFTDNVVIGYPISDKGRDDAEVELQGIISHLSYFQMNMILNGFFIRGAVSIGDLFIDSNIVFGPGLIEAYNGERTLARDPRIILTKSASKALHQHIKYYSKTWLPQKRVIYRDSDGQFLINYLDVLNPEHDVFFAEEFEKHRDIIQNNLKTFKNRPLIWSKYLWVANYHNFFCRQYPELDFDKCIINLDEFQLLPALISH